MWITPSDQWGPIAGRKEKGKHTIYNPGDPMDFPEIKALKLIASGKAIKCDAPKKKKGRKKDAKKLIASGKAIKCDAPKKKKGRKKDANS